MRFERKHLPQTKHLFFTGKGGAGKTSTAAASAIALADEGKNVLIVSTDPASNLQDVFDMELSNKQTAVFGINGLFAINIDPEEAARAYREKMVGPYRGKLPKAAIESMEEQLSGACTVEIAAFDEFTSVLASPETNEAFDHIIFDTAPTGYTLRLLQLPTAWSDFLDNSTHGASCLGPMAGLQEKENLYNQTVKTLADPEKTSLFLIARPEQSSLTEAGRASAELNELGIANQFLLLNGVHPFTDSPDKIAAEYIRRQQQALSELPKSLEPLPHYHIPLFPENIEGVKGLRSLLQKEIPKTYHPIDNSLTAPDLPGLNNLIDDLINQDSRLILTMGKGGVGKTATAAEIALTLAERGHSVHLTTTDPANHLHHSLRGKKLPSSMTVSSIDPETETNTYKQNVLARVSDDLDEDSLAYLKEDLDSPCTEEIAVFHAFAKTAARAENEFVVLDTAPTGHTLLLLDAAESYHQEVLRSQGELPAEVKELLPRLRDREQTAVLIITLPETTPVLEAERLETDLNRAGMKPAWWIINHSFLASHTKDPVLAGRAAQEMKWITRTRENHKNRTCLVPYKPE
ncbi:arsenical pump-driving ATPase [Alteribacillus sp. YIM 98480]|uniref:arsenical pump-driving ATPase n=1 Tax=Alteribacillus sp. YIM 98480 TaxID=2606599 RepID=UPI00131CAA1C|nr:arsenical pump-driving ATPase [Alteribacillus sp. YIM 98480]